MSDIVEFIQARLEEDERIAREAETDPHSSFAAFRVGLGSPFAPSGLSPDDAVVLGDAAFDHADRHSPARVLRQCAGIHIILEAYREAVEINEVEAWTSYGKYALPGIAMTWADHPDYRSEWSPKPRLVD